MSSEKQSLSENYLSLEPLSVQSTTQAIETECSKFTSVKASAIHTDRPHNTITFYQLLPWSLYHSSWTLKQTLVMVHIKHGQYDWFSSVIKKAKRLCYLQTETNKLRMFLFPIHLHLTHVYIYSENFSTNETNNHGDSCPCLLPHFTESHCHSIQSLLSHQC